MCSDESSPELPKHPSPRRVITENCYQVVSLFAIHAGEPPHKIRNGGINREKCKILTVRLSIDEMSSETAI